MIQLVLLSLIYFKWSADNLHNVDNLDAINDKICLL